MDMTVGESTVLSASGAEGIVFSSSDESVATVAEDGTLQAVGAGSAIVTAKAGEQTATCQVTVEEAAQPDTPVTPTVKELVLQSIYGSKGDISIGVGEKAPMKVMGTESAVTWSMENAAVATVDESGAVTGVASGKTTLTATVDGQTLYCTIRVR